MNYSKYTGAFKCIPEVLFRGFCVGFSAWMLLKVAYFAISLLWGPEWLAGEMPWWHSLLFCPIGGLLIGVWESKFHTSTPSMFEVLGIVKETGTYAIEKPFHSFVSFILPITFGATVGPEAGLTGVITVGSLWTKRHLSKSLGHDILTEEKRVLYPVGILGGCMGIALVIKLFGHGMEFPWFGPIHASLYDIPALILLSLSGWLLAVYYKTIFAFALRIKALLHNSEIACGVLGGILLGIAGTVFPYVLGPGAKQAISIVLDQSTFSAITLCLMALVKLALLACCLNFCWKGGPFFPLICSGVMFGLSMSKIFGIDPALGMTCVLVSLIARFMGNPIIGFVHVVPSIPFSSLGWALVPAVIGGKLPLPQVLVAATTVDNRDSDE